jgi:transposase InsO family protein
VATAIQTNETQPEQQEIIQVDANIPFNNTDLCFFTARVGAPSKAELEPLLRKAHERGTFLHGKEILNTLQEDREHTDEYLPAQHERRKLLTLHEVPRTIRESKDIGNYEMETRAFADSGSSCSIISKDLATALRLVTLQAADALTVVDINKKRNVHSLVTYVQLEFPGTNYRQIVLCLVMEKTPHPFLLGSNDQAQLNIKPDLSTRTITLGPKEHPVAEIPFRENSDPAQPTSSQTNTTREKMPREPEKETDPDINKIKARLPSLACLMQFGCPLGDENCMGNLCQACDYRYTEPIEMIRPDTPEQEKEQGAEDQDLGKEQVHPEEKPNNKNHHELAEQVFIAYCAALETEEPLYVDYTQEHLPQSTTRNLSICTNTGTKDYETKPSLEETTPDSNRTENQPEIEVEEPELKTGLPKDATPPEPPKRTPQEDAFDWLYTEYLRTVQKIEMASELAIEEKQKELEEDLDRLWKYQCSKELEELRPEDFPKELWKYVMDLQKPLVKDRFAKFPDPIRTQLISDIMEKLDIYDIKDAKEFFRAQALANIDVMGHPDPSNPPTIPGYDFTIDVNTKEPVYLKPQKFNQTETAFLEARIAELMSYGKIRPSQSMYNTHLCLVPYHDRITKSITKWGANAVSEMFKPENRAEVATWYRLTNNFKPINAITKAFHFPMPNADDIYHYTRGARYWSLTDIKDAFFVVKMDDKSSQYTAFTTPGGRWEFTVMPQGAQNSPMFWSSIAADTFSHIPKDRLINFIDDTTCHSRRFLHHIESQQMMFDAMREKRMVSKLSKCHYLYPSAKILGQIMSEFGRTPSPESIQPILDMAPPRNIGDLRSLLGLINFNLDYLPMAKNFLGPLQELLKKDADVARDWNESHDIAFEQAKQALTSAPCLLTIDITKPFVVHVDACRVGRGIGAVLLQQNERGDWRPVAYYSYRLKEGERTRCATELEAMALVYAIKHWSSYLRVQEFSAIVDHHALLYLVTQPAKTSNVRLLNWISDLHAYRFRIYHRSGKKHMDADAVSRLLQYRDLDVHNAMDTNDEEAARLNGPATVKDIIDLYRIIGAYQDQIEALKAQLEEANPKFLEEKRQEIQKAYEDRAKDIEERKALYEKMSNNHENDYWRLISSRDWQDHQEMVDEEDIPPNPEKQAKLQSELTPEDEWIRYQPHDQLVRENPEDEPENEEELPETPEPIDERPAKDVIAPGQKRIKASKEKEGEPTKRYPTRAYTRQLGLSNANEVEELRAPNLPRALLRRNYRPVGPRRKQYIPNHTLPLPVPSIESRQDAFDYNHPELADYKDLEWKVFQDPITQRIYRVMFIYYEHQFNAVAAYRKVLDDLPPDPLDAYPWLVTGRGGIQELVEKYQENNIDAPEGPLIPWPKSEQDMLNLQGEDPNLQPILTRIKSKANEEGVISDKDREFKYTASKLIYLPKDNEGQDSALRIRHPADEPEPERDRIAFPLALVPTLLQLYHDQLAHPGFHRTLGSIKLKYWWPTMRHNILTYVQSCQFCEWAKVNKQAANVPIQQYDPPSRPWGDIHWDLCGPFRKTARGNCYIGVAKCTLTRTIVLKALTSKQPIETARMLINKVYLKHGAPDVIHTDQGTEFINTVIEQINALFQVKHVPTTPGNPRSNGLAEQHMGVLKDQLTAFTNAIQDDWDTYLPTIEFAYNTTVNSQTGYTPFFMLYGREASQPHETWIGAFQKITSLSHYVRRLVTTLQATWEYAAKQKPKEVKKFNKIPMKRRTFTEYEVGDRFYLAERPATEYQHYADKSRSKITLKPKMQIRFVGPFTVTKKFSPVLYEARINGTLRAVHALGMKPDPVSKYYNMHRHELTPMEKRKIPEFHPRILPSGKPHIPHRVHKRLRSPDSKLNKADQDQDSEEEADEEEEQNNPQPEENEDDEDIEYDSEEDDD